VKEAEEYIVGVLTALGQMNNNKDHTLMEMLPSVRSKIIHDGWWQILPLLNSKYPFYPERKTVHTDIFWIKDPDTTHDIYELWEASGVDEPLIRIAAVQVFKDGSAGYWFEIGQVAKPVCNLDTAMRIVEEKVCR
jgi:hypothetical protein